MARAPILSGRIGRLLRSGINAVFPLRCRQCDTLYALQETPGETGPTGMEDFNQPLAEHLCPQCVRGYEPIKSPLCEICGLPYLTDHGVDHACANCLKRPLGFAAARAAGYYQQPLKTLIHQYKYQGRTELSRPFGQLLWDALHRFYDLSEFDLIVPVPLHWFRQYQRGFNQAALPMRHWRALADEQDIDFNPKKVALYVLRRRKRTVAQTGLGKKQRAVNLKDAFVVSQPDDVQGKRILLVDDVMTTGATVNACTKVLKRSGAASVKVLALARADW